MANALANIGQFASNVGQNFGNALSGVSKVAMPFVEGFASVGSPNYRQAKQLQQSEKSLNLNMESQRLSNIIKIIGNPYFSKELRIQAAQMLSQLPSFKMLANATGRTDLLAEDYDWEKWLNEKDTGTRRSVRMGPAGQILGGYETSNPQNNALTSTIIDQYYRIKGEYDDEPDKKSPEAKRKLQLLNQIEERIGVDLTNESKSEEPTIKKSKKKSPDEFAESIQKNVNETAKTLLTMGAKAGSQAIEQEKAMVGPPASFAVPTEKQYPEVKTNEDYARLPSGTIFIDPEGKLRKKP